jgi:type IV pilus assembly protein PilB
MPNIDLTLQQFAREDEEKQAKENAEKLKLPYINLVGYPIVPEVLNMVPRDLAQTQGIIAYLRAENIIKIATNRTDIEKVNEEVSKLTSATKTEFKLSFASESSVRYGLALYDVLLPKKEVSEGVQVTQAKQKEFSEDIKSFSDFQEKIRKVPTTEFLDVVFAGATSNDATDIHIEPQENDFRIRFRIDGVLQDIANLPRETYLKVLSRIKYLAKLKLDVTSPQDGRFDVTVNNEAVDIRVSSLPTSYGEAVVMRLLPKSKRFVTLDGLELNSEVIVAINSAISKPQGMILNTGPTGSGKTTTLYAMLQKLNQPGRKIITLENPIEYRVEGIEQIQIDVENRTSFLDALKAALRQDPDIMMIGEIRDHETAEIALQAAMTGHLVLSTLHANNAPASLARLTEMGIEPYLLAGSINLILGQRLVRKICSNCKGQGCEICRKTGFKGRTAIIEALVPGKEIEELITRRAALRTFEETAHQLGMKTMYEDGMAKVAQGITTKEEIERVTKE